MKISREKLSGLVVMLIAFFSITSALNVKASFWQNMFSNESGNKEKSIFDISDLDSDSDGLSDKEEYKLGTNPYKADSDEDGYTDKEEVIAGYDPLKQEGNNLIDIDGDGLTGEDEKKYGTNPNKVDTDYDGYPDGMEVIFGKDPLKADYSFLDPIIEGTEKIKSENNENTCTGENCPSSEEEFHYERSAPESIENILNAKTFSDIPAESFSSIGVDASKLNLEQKINFPEISDEDIKISEDTSKEFIQDYFNILGIALYSYSPVHSIDEAESFAGTINITNSSQVKNLEDIVLKIKGEFKETKVPNKPEFIEFHRQVLISTTVLQELFNSLENTDFNGNNAFYEVMNLLPQFSSLNDYIFDQVYPRAQELAAENGVALPNRNFLEQHQ